MSAFGAPVLINPNRSYWLSSIGTDVVHSTIVTGTIDASGANFSTMNADKANISTLNVSSFNLQSADISGMYVSSIRGNTGFFSSFSLASDLSGGVGYVRFSVDASGIQVDGDPIRFDNLVYLTSSINIIQVSTLVDTDIFGSNGYFSTFSTGSLSTGFASLLQANISSLYVSSLEGFDISGAQPVEWSLYPTLNSSITFNPGYVLSNVSQKLYFAGQELTDLSGGGQNWSQFPALYDVSMNDFSLRAVSTIQFQDSATLTSQTGNNLFYNGQPIQYGSASNVSQWANYTAVNNVTLGGNAISTSGNLVMNVASNVSTSCQDYYVMADNGVNVASVADLTLVAQNGNKGRINLTANPGFNNGVFGEINLTANGGSIGGVGSGGLITLNANTPAGFSNLTSAVKISGAGVNSYAGLVPNVGSLAGYNFIYGSAGVNICAGLPSVFPNVPLTTFLYGTAGVTTSSDFYCPTIQPYWNGLTTPNDLIISGRSVNLQQVYLQLSNVKYLYMQGAGQIQNANLVSSVSTIGAVANFGLGQFTTLNGTTTNATTLNAGTLNANTISTSLVQAPLLSTININLSTINGIDWQDISGGVFTTTSTFNQLYTSTAQISTLVAPGFPGQNFMNVYGQGLIFKSTNTSYTETFLSSLTNIFSPNRNFLLQASTISLSASGNDVRIGGGGAYDSHFRPVGIGIGLSTIGVMTSSIITPGALDISGGINVTNDVNIPDGKAVGFTSGEGYTRLERRDIATNNMLSVTNFAGLASNNMAPLGVGELWFGGGADSYQACRLYSVFPYGNYELDAIDADGATLFAYMQGYENGAGLNPGFVQAYSNVSSISGYDQESASNQMLHIINGLTTSNLIVSSINGQQFSGGGGGSVTSSFQTLFTSSFQFSTATSVGSNTGFNYPIFCDWDQANGGANAGVAIAVQGHNYATGAVVNRIEMGCRGDGTNYIMSVWPGQNLEDLVIDATQVTIRDTDGFSTIINENPYGIATNGVAKIGAGSGVVMISTNNVKVGGVNEMTALSLSSIIINTPYGNNIYNAGLQMPYIAHGWSTLGAGGGAQSMEITLPFTYDEHLKPFDVQVTYRNGNDNTPLYWSTTTTGSSFWVFGGSGMEFSWTTYGDLPFTG